MQALPDHARALGRPMNGCQAWRDGTYPGSHAFDCTDPLACALESLSTPDSNAELVRQLEELQEQVDEIRREVATNKTKLAGRIREILGPMWH